MEEQASLEDAKQQMAFIYQLFQQRLQELSQQASLLERAFFEVESTREGLKSINEISKGEVLIPMGNGCYIRGRGLPEKTAKKVLVGVGSNILLEKTPREADLILRKRGDELQNALDSTAQEMQKVSHQMNTIVRNLQKG
jgi:prefoldin alpha subunit